MTIYIQFKGNLTYYVSINPELVVYDFANHSLSY